MMNLYQLAVSPDDSSAFRWFLEISSETSTINSIAGPTMRLNVCDEMVLIDVVFLPTEERDACY